MIVFKDGQIIPNLAPAKIKSLHSCEYAKDDTKVYHSTNIIPGADATTFTVYGGNNYCYAHDKLNVYYEGVLIPDANPIKMRRIKKGDSHSPYTDGKNIYYYAKKLDIDANNYQYLGKSTIKDLFFRVLYRQKNIWG